MKLLANYQGYATFQVTDAEYEAMRWLGLPLAQAAYENNRAKIAQRAASQVSSGASLPSLVQASVGTPIVLANADPYALPDFNIGPPGDVACQGCSEKISQPQGYAQVYGISEPAKAAASNPPSSGLNVPAGGLVELNVDTSPLLLVGGLLAYWMFFRKK